MFYFLSVSIKMGNNEIVGKKVEYWKGRLIDLSKKNNLVSYVFVKSRSIEIIEPVVSCVIEDLYSERKISFAKKDRKVLKEQVWRSEGDDKPVDKKLFSLYRKTLENFQESGISSCFVSLFILEYEESKSSGKIEAPLFLFPCDN